MYLNFETAGALVRLNNAVTDSFTPHKDRVASANSAVSDIQEALFDLGLELELQDNEKGLSVKINLDGENFSNDLMNLYGHLNDPNNAVELYRTECSNLLKEFIKENPLFALDKGINATNLLRISELIEEGAHPDIYGKLEELNDELQVILGNIADASQVTSSFVELCPHCEYEVGLEYLGRSECPVCGKQIATCAMCDMENCELCNTPGKTGLGFVATGTFLLGYEGE